MSYWSRSFQGQAACLSEVRRFAAAIVGDGPGSDLVVLAVSELAANAILHTASGEPGGQFVVHVATYADRWQVRVDDSGGPKVPRICSTNGTGPAGANGTSRASPGGGVGPADTADSAPADRPGYETEPEAGRGLALVAAVSRTWGVLGNEYSRAVWAEIPHLRSGDDGPDHGPASPGVEGV